MPRLGSALISTAEGLLLGGTLLYVNFRSGSGPGGRSSRKQSVGELSRAFQSPSDRFAGSSGHRTSQVVSDHFRLVPSFNPCPQSAARSLNPTLVRSSQTSCWNARSSCD
jgi:hypothetical protein